jgi:hypothetical protein
MLGRRIGEPGNYKGTGYIANEFKRLGLKPAGDNGTYFQNLPYGPSGFDINASKLIVAGKPLAPRTDWVPVVPTAANGVGASASLDNVQAIYAGRFGDTTTLDPAVFRGKIAVLTATPAQAGLAGGGRAAQPMLRCDSLPNKFGAEAAARVEAQQRADSAARAGGRGGRGGGAGGAPRDTRAQRAGAVGILYIALVDTTGRGAFNSRMGMQVTPAPGSLPSAAITRTAAENLFGKSADQLTVGAVSQPVTAQWNYAFRMSDTPARNVIAILPGSDPARASEYVLVGAHNDHVGVNTTVVDHDSLRAVNMVTRRQGANDPVCRPTDDQWKQINSMIARARSIRPPRRDSIMNGADDDGSGTVIMLEVAERFAAEKPARSIIFISHQGEEAGLLGSRWFTDHPTVPIRSSTAGRARFKHSGRVAYRVSSATSSTPLRRTER